MHRDKTKPYTSNFVYEPYLHELFIFLKIEIEVLPRYLIFIATKFACELSIFRVNIDNYGLRNLIILLVINFNNTVERIG